MLPIKHHRMALTLAMGLIMMPFCVPVTADLRYDETTEIKGGVFESLGKIGGMFGAKSPNKTTTITYLKGDRLRKDQLEGQELENSQIIQLDLDRILMLDHKKKSYTVMTFAEMRAQMEKAMASMKSAPQNQPPAKDNQNPQVKVEPKINVKDTGETRVINGFNTRRVLMTVELEGEDQKTKDKGAMGADTEVWLTKEVAGFEEQNRFNLKYAQKMASPELVKNLGDASAMRQDPRFADSAQALHKKLESLDGMAILTIMSFNLSGTASPQTQEQASTPSRQPEPERQPESVGAAIGKSLGGFGGFGGLGGFGRRKKKEEPPPPPTAQTAPPAAANSSDKVTATLMTSTTELKNFSRGTLEASLFDVPAGYKLKTRD